MLLYYARKYTSATAGVRLVEVRCDRCGCVYFYELARVGSGSADAPYAIGGERAARKAEERAGRDLERRLAGEAELVPCPGCQWIDEDQVARYRRSRRRGWLKFAAIVGLGGPLASLIGAWFVWIGPAADREALPYFLLAGPAISLALAGSIVGLRHSLLRTIRPNRDHPFAPKIPPGSPRPLIRNAATGRLEPAGATDRPDGADGAWIEFQVGRSVLPGCCCGCLAPADPRFAYVHPPTAVAFPLCDRCGRRWTLRMWLGALAGAATVAAVGLPVLFALELDEIIFWVAAGALMTLIPIIGALIVGHQTSPVRAKDVDRSRGVALLRFRNETYSKLVAVEQNGAPGDESIFGR